MKAPGLGRLCFTLEDKGDFVLSMSALSGIRTVCRGCFTVIDDPRASVYFSRNGKTNRQLAEQSTD